LDPAFGEEYIMSDTHIARKICIIGATSAMAEQTARKLAEKGDALVLIARDSDKLEPIATDLKVRGATHVSCFIQDFAQLDDPRALLMRASEAMGGLDGVLIFHGYLGDQAKAVSDLEHLRAILAINFNSPVEIACAAASLLERSTHPKPILLAVGSVAGDRGRASNFVYGAAKGGLGIAFQGIAQSFAHKGLAARAVLVKAGFTDTPMTAGIQKGGPLWASAEAVAGVIVTAMDKSGPIVYAPFFWRSIMLIIRALPTPIMNRLKF
jgi:decaprenylphospho-beta-D-erythro-pentofuranosid-2-ulose 2-reductase